MSAAAAVQVSSVTARPFLRWAGGKTQLLPEIRKHVPKSFRTYYEPLVGAAALFFDLAPRRAVLGDMNGPLIVTYVAIKDDVEFVIDELKSGMFKDTKARYYEVRSMDPLAFGVASCAARVIYMNKVNFNGLWRVNAQGGFNVPYDASRKGRRVICDEENLRLVSKALKRAVIRHADFEVVIRGAERGDFVYFDPPYVPRPKEDASESDFTQYTRDGFTLDDQARLAKCALALKKRGVHVLLSNSDTPKTRAIYKRVGGFEMRTVQARRAINSRADSRGPVGELLIW